MSFTSVNYGQSYSSRYFKDFLDSRYDSADCGVDLVVPTLDRPKTVLVDEVPLHVDNDECCFIWGEAICVGPSI